jgi:WD40 repeat protein
MAPDGNTLISAGDKTIKFWSLADGSLLRTIEEPDAVGRLRIVPDGKALVSTLEDTPVVKGRRAARPVGLIRKWSLPDGKLEKTLNGHTARINALVLTPDGRSLITASADKTIRIWSLPDGTLRKTISNKNAVTALAITPDGKTLISADSPYFPPTRTSLPPRSKKAKAYDSVKVWSLPEGRLLKSLPGPDRNVRALEVTPDGNTLIAGSVEGQRSIWAWTLPEGRLLWGTGAFGSSADSLAVSPDGKILAAGGMFPASPSRYSVWLLSLPNGAPVKTLNMMAGLNDPRWAVEAVMFTPDGKGLVSGDFVGHVILSRDLSPKGRCALVDPKAAAWKPNFAR